MAGWSYKAALRTGSITVDDDDGGLDRGEARLWRSVIARTAKDYILGLTRRFTLHEHQKSHEYRVWKSAHYWLMSLDSGGGSFIWACEQCGRDPDITRNKILACSSADAQHKVRYSGPLASEIEDLLADGFWDKLDV